MGLEFAFRVGLISIFNDFCSQHCSFGMKIVLVENEGEKVEDVFQCRFVQIACRESEDLMIANSIFMSNDHATL